MGFVSVINWSFQAKAELWNIVSATMMLTVPQNLKTFLNINGDINKCDAVYL